MVNKFLMAAMNRLSPLITRRTGPWGPTLAYDLAGRAKRGASGLARGFEAVRHRLARRRRLLRDFAQLDPSRPSAGGFRRRRTATSSQALCSLQASQAETMHMRGGEQELVLGRASAEQGQSHRDQPSRPPSRRN